MSTGTHDAYLAFFADPKLRDALDRLARANDRSRSAELRRAVRSHLHRQASGIRLAHALAANKKATE